MDIGALLGQSAADVDGLGDRGKSFLAPGPGVEWA
jgi:hypothetical protein